MSDDALDRLMNKRSRPKVPHRPNEVIDAVSQDINTSLSQDMETNSSQSLESSNRQDTKVKKPQGAQTSKRKREKMPLPLDIKTIRSTTRLEESVDTELRQLCTRERLTKEVWFEAAFLYLSENPKALEKVNQLAHERLQQRKEIADLKRAMTMKERVEERLRE